MNKIHFLCRQRNSLLGIGAIGVLIVHSSLIINYPNYLKVLVGYGGLGVYLFTFISGIGLYFSLQNSRRSRIDFYKRRYVRLFVPYFLIAGVWYGIKYLLLTQNIGSFFYELSTLSFWVEHRGAWYVAMLIPLYLVYPLFFDWMEKGRRLIKTVIAIGVILIVSLTYYNVNLNQYNHLSQIFCSLVIFLIGNYVAEHVYKENYRGVILLIGSLTLFIIKMTTTLKEIALVYCK